MRGNVNVNVMAVQVVYFVQSTQKVHIILEAALVPLGDGSVNPEGRSKAFDGLPHDFIQTFIIHTG